MFIYNFLTIKFLTILVFTSFVKLNDMSFFNNFYIFSATQSCTDIYKKDKKGEINFSFTKIHLNTIYTIRIINILWIFYFF